MTQTSRWRDSAESRGCFGAEERWISRVEMGSRNQPWLMCGKKSLVSILRWGGFFGYPETPIRRLLVPIGTKSEHQQKMLISYVYTDPAIVNSDTCSLSWLPRAGIQEPPHIYAVLLPTCHTWILQLFLLVIYYGPPAIPASRIARCYQLLSINIENYQIDQKYECFYNPSSMEQTLLGWNSKGFGTSRIAISCNRIPDVVFKSFDLIHPPISWPVREKSKVHLTSIQRLNLNH